MKEKAWFIIGVESLKQQQAYADKILMTASAGSFDQLPFEIFICMQELPATAI